MTHKFCDCFLASLPHVYEIIFSLLSNNKQCGDQSGYLNRADFYCLLKFDSGCSRCNM